VTSTLASEGADAGNGLQYGLHGGSGGDELGTSFGAQQFRFRFQALGTLQSSMQFDLRPQDGQQAFVLPRLLNEVARPPAHGLDRQPHVAPGRHHDYRNAAIEGHNLGEQVQAFLTRGGIAGVVQINQHGIIEVAGESFPHRCWGLRGVNFKALRAKQQFDRFENVRLIVSRKNAASLLPVTGPGCGILYHPRASLALRLRQYSLRQGAMPFTASWI
jgi:hypothetical protein